jgi:alpha-1,3-rhamnosyl/mannosyltransferase
MTTYFVDARSATPHFPGIGRYVTNLVPELYRHISADEALQVLLPPRQEQLRDEGEPWSVSLAENSRCTLFTSTASNFGLAQQWNVPRIIRQARPNRPALYHSPYYLMPYRTGLPNIVTLHDLIALVLPESVSPRARWFFRIAVYAALRAASHVIIVSESARQDLLRYFPLHPGRVTAIPNAAAARFHPQPEEALQVVRHTYQLPSAFLFYCGINKPHKNLMRLIDAYAAMEATTPPLIIAGAWDNRYPEPKQRAAQLGLQDRVRFIGRVSDEELPALYGAATLFVFPSLYEGFGLPVIEAMACGAPVACSDAVGLRDVAGSAALLFNPQETSSITHALRTGLENSNLLAEMRGRSLAQAKSFSWSSTAQQTLAVYRDVLRQKGSTGKGANFLI